MDGLEEARRVQEVVQEEREEFILNRFLVMEDYFEDKTSEEVKLNSEYCLAKLHIPFEKPALVPLEPRGVQERT